MPARTVARDRYSFGNLDEALQLPDLIAIQRDSFSWFLEQGLADAFRDISPIKDFTENLQLELEFDPLDEDLKPYPCLLYTSPSPRDKRQSRMPSSA